ncbi:MAG: sporulation protein YqfD [Eubacteriaceae bacterium]|nr:sporulation protein YqfD [Eubacteriaceae bacterium]
MDNILLKIKSYNIISVKTREPEKALNLINRNGIAIWDAVYDGNILQFKAVNSDVSRLNEVLSVFTTEAVVEKQLGAQRALRYIAGRKAFFSSLAVVVAAILFFASFIWKIEIYGARDVETSDILNALYDNGIRQSTKKSSIDTKEAEIVILESFSGIADAMCEIKGSVLLISIVERETPLVQFDKSIPVDLIAATDATVMEYEVYNGTPNAHVGKEVKEGDTLISGLVPYEYRNEKGYQKVHALGVALTYEQITMNTSITLYKPIVGAEHVAQKIYYLFSREFSATNGQIEEGSLFLLSEKQNVRLGWIELPILYDEYKWYTMDNCMHKGDDEIYGEIYNAALAQISPKQSVRSIAYHIDSLEGQNANITVLIDVATNIAIEKEI